MTSGLEIDKALLCLWPVHPSGERCSTPMVSLYRGMVSRSLAASASAALAGRILIFSPGRRAGQNFIPSPLGHSMRRVTTMTMHGGEQWISRERSTSLKEGRRINMERLCVPEVMYLWYIEPKKSCVRRGVESHWLKQTIESSSTTY